jgi:hypothetical protein
MLSQDEGENFLNITEPLSQCLKKELSETGIPFDSIDRNF